MILASSFPPERIHLSVPSTIIAKLVSKSPMWHIKMFYLKNFHWFGLCPWKMHPLNQLICTIKRKWNWKSLENFLNIRTVRNSPLYWSFNLTFISNRLLIDVQVQDDLLKSRIKKNIFVGKFRMIHSFPLLGIYSRYWMVGFKP